MTTSINDTLKEHVVDLADWKYRKLTITLHEWAERFNTSFKLEIETPVINIDSTRIHTIGSYRPSRNGFGLRHEITFNSTYLDCPFAEHLDTLLHELLHEWQELQGKPGKSSKYNYHNREFREKAFSYGLVISKHGNPLGVVPGRFTELLERYGVDTSCLQSPPKFESKNEYERAENSGVRSNRASGNSKMKKWFCSCSPVVNIRAAVKINAKCMECGELFQRE
jgi:hypothetical protein